MADMIPFGSIAQYAGPNVASWPIGAAITKVIFLPGNWQVEFTRQWGSTRWPDAIPPGWEGPLQFTLWPVVLVDGQWRACPAIEFWYQPEPEHGRYDGVGGPYSKGLADWWYHVPEMQRQPAAGETVGFFVTTAVRRMVSDTSWTTVHERSDVVICSVPVADNGSYTFTGTIPDPEPPDGGDGGDGGTTPPGDEALDANTLALGLLTDAIDHNTVATGRNTEALDALTAAVKAALVLGRGGDAPPSTKKH